MQLSAWHQYHVNLVVPYKLRGHNVVTNIMVGGYAGVYYFDEFQVRGGALRRNSGAIRNSLTRPPSPQVVNKAFVSPPPSPPSPPPSPPPNVLLQLNLESTRRGRSTRRRGPRAR